MNASDMLLIHKVRRAYIYYDLVAKLHLWMIDLQSPNISKYVTTTF